jgi:hypothetical protein
MACPDCRSDNAVSKAEAWDALTSLPPRAKSELERLSAISNAASEIAVCYRELLTGKPIENGVALMTIPVEFLEALDAAFKAKQ